MVSVKTPKIMFEQFYANATSSKKIRNIRHKKNLILGHLGFFTKKIPKQQFSKNMFHLIFSFQF